jgi:hypothetical protein
MNTPTVIFIFNRPELTLKVFDSIRQVKPKILFVIADGPRTEKVGELERCKKTRMVTEIIDWDCEVFRNYSDVNMGCGPRVSSGIDWVFERVDKAIILEDDCLPHPDFFPFCEELLSRYENDERITMISGTNYFPRTSSNTRSYHFSFFPGGWGWATWRRAWKLYDYEMNLFPKYSDSNSDFLEHVFSNKYHQNLWKKTLQKNFEAKNKSTWDFQWAFAQWIHGGLGIIPDVNLISNIGFGVDATHTKRTSDISNLSTSSLIFPLTHPHIMHRNLKMDILIQDKVFNHSLLSKIKKYIRGKSMSLYDKIIIR